MKKALLYVFDAQDHFGVTPSYYINGRRQYHLLLSKIVSVLINTAAAILFITMLVELISKSKPTVNTVSLHSSYAPNITINTEDLVISFGILDQNYQIFNDDSIVSLKAYYELTITDGDEVINYVEPLEEVSCTIYNEKMYRKYGYEKEFFANNLDKYHCYNYTKSGVNPVLGGNFGTDYYGVISIELRKCVNDTESGKENCKEENVIKETVKGMWFEVFFLDHFVDIYNYSNPVQTYSSSIYSFIDSELKKSFWTYFEKSDIFTDNGLIFTLQNTKSTVKFEKSSLDSSIAQGDRYNNLLLNFVLISSLKKEEIYRTYIKLQSVCANVAGIITGAHIIGQLLLSYFELSFYQNYLMTALFEFSSVKLPHNSFDKEIHLNNSKVKLKSFEVSDTKSFKTIRKQKSMRFNFATYVFSGITCFDNPHTKYLKLECRRMLKIMREKLELTKNILIQNQIEIIKVTLSRLPTHFTLGRLSQQYNKFQIESGTGLRRCATCRNVNLNTESCPNSEVNNSDVVSPAKFEKIQNKTLSTPFANRSHLKKNNFFPYNM